MGDGIAYRIIEWFMETIMPWLIIVMAVIVVCLFGVLLHKEFIAPPETEITLVKSEWACTGSHKVPITTYVMAGKVMVPITSNHLECTQWSRQP